ncbi:MAG: 16S rRNA (cytosine(1402)-N(4))-methyltransferase RsmH [Patescibacteria group bacterium]
MERNDMDGLQEENFSTSRPTSRKARGDRSIVSAPFGHISVLLHEAIDGLDLKSGDILLDGTLGSGGHTEGVVKRHGDSIKIIALDADEDALARSKKRLAEYKKSDITFVQENFRNLDKVLDTLKIEHVTKVLLDIGLSSNQFEESGRGFSFQKDEPLAMTFKKNPSEEDVTARVIVNEWSEETLNLILKGYGEEQFAYKIAKAIVATREEYPIETTGELVAIIDAVVPGWYKHRKMHFATKTFQALRIAANDELKALEEGIKKAFDKLEKNGRLAVISFHSLEDRIVKQFFKQKQTEGTAILLTKKPIIPSDEELEVNRRARSAKLRILVKQ